MQGHRRNRLEFPEQLLAKKASGENKGREERSASQGGAGFFHPCGLSSHSKALSFTLTYFDESH